MVSKGNAVLGVFVQHAPNPLNIKDKATRLF
jgi:hypothetical protein